MLDLSRSGDLVSTSPSVCVVQGHREGIKSQKGVTLDWTLAARAERTMEQPRTESLLHYGNSPTSF